MSRDLRAYNETVLLFPGHSLGESGGEPVHTLSIPEMPMHVHAMQASSSATGGNSSPAGRFWAAATTFTTPRRISRR